MDEEEFEKRALTIDEMDTVLAAIEEEHTKEEPQLGTVAQKAAELRVLCDRLIEQCAAAGPPLEQQAG